MLTNLRSRQCLGSCGLANGHYLHGEQPAASARVGCKGVLLPSSEPVQTAAKTFSASFLRYSHDPLAGYPGQGTYSIDQQGVLLHLGLVWPARDEPSAHLDGGMECHSF